MRSATGRFLGGVLGALACLQAAVAAPAAPPLAAEESDVATLSPQVAHRAFLWGGLNTPGVYVVNADAGAMEGLISKSEYSNFAIDPAGRYFYVAETMWTRINRGDRLDMISVYDSSTLNLVKEIPLPGRLLAVPMAQQFALSESGRYGYVYNMEPASSVFVVDLSSRKTVGNVELPGCALVLPFGELSFASICGNGELASVVLDAKLKPTVNRAQVFDSVADPVFDKVAIDVRAREAFLVSYNGLVYRVALGAKLQVDAPWSLQTAAGVRAPAASDSPADVAWRPGGSQVVAYHAPSHRLFVLMHVGEAWSQKKDGSEIWVFDTQARALLKRLKVTDRTWNIAISQDIAPVLYLSGYVPKLVVMNPDTGEVLKSVDDVGGGPVATAAR